MHAIKASWLYSFPYTGLQGREAAMALTPASPDSLPPLGWLTADEPVLAVRGPGCRARLAEYRANHPARHRRPHRRARLACLHRSAS